MGTTRKQAAPFYFFPPKLHAEFSCLINAVPTFYGYLRHLILVFKEIGTWRFAPAVYFVIVIGMAAAIYDLFRLSGSKNTEEIMPEAERIQGIQRLILLDEEGKPIKSWDLQGKISLIIGKAGRDQELDIDLSDCEYSSFIDFQHAVLNFCLDQWYVEDLGSQNGVKVGKVEDGECYRVIHRPCKVVAGDVLYIANMLDWQSEFEKDAPIFQNYQKFRDDWDAILKSYGFVKR